MQLETSIRTIHMARGYYCMGKVMYHIRYVIRALLNHYAAGGEFGHLLNRSRETCQIHRRY